MRSRRGRSPASAVAIVRNDSVIYAKGFGVSVRGEQDARQRTNAVRDRVELEGVHGDARRDARQRRQDAMGRSAHRRICPDFRMYDPVANEGVTLRDALSHRSGIARGELVWLGAGISRDEVLHRVRFLKPESPFRSKWSYQNMMFLAAGQAAGKVAGTTWDDLVRQRIFTPLGMTASVATATGLTNPNAARPHGMDHDTAFVKPPFDGENIAPAGSILSNAVDMAQWLRFQLNDGVVNGKRLLSSAALRETHSPQILMAPRRRRRTRRRRRIPSRRRASTRTGSAGWSRTIATSSCGSTAATRRA